MKIKSKIIGLVFLIGILATACTDNAGKEATKEKASISANDTKTVANKKNNAAKTEDPNAKYPSFDFQETKYEFGDINKGDIVKHTFKFKNTGEAPLLINDIRTTCGCTTPKYTKEPIAPGADGEILVQFNSSGKQGIQNKRITILSNVKGGTSVINITANVLAESKGPYKTQK